MRIRSVRMLVCAFLPSLLLALVVLSLSTASFAQIGVAITIGPPPIPIYEQPLCPGDGYLWVPGYWAYDYDINDYYWVPGTWILAPEVGFLWTPGWWGWEGGHFRWWDGYWGPHVGFYGGINYGFGYFGTGFEGGRWDGGHFFYNRAVMNINVNEIHNVYNTTVINRNENHVAFNGGNGGINARPTSEEEAWGRERHIGPVAAQTEHIQAARNNPQMRASANMGRPPIAATARAGEFSGRGVVAAREAGGSYTPAHGGGMAKGGGNAVHPHELPPVQRPSAPNTGNPKMDQKYQREQDKLVARQNQERDKLQQQQEKEHQQLARQKAPPERTQQVEQKHQQQTQQLQQKHQQQTQQMQQRQSGNRGKK
ncbi:MAG: YXWGXW repeat-containing protein [Terriglobales bacterium]